MGTESAVSTMNFGNRRQAFRVLNKSNQSSSVLQTKNSIRKRLGPREDHFGPRLAKIYAKVPWMLYAYRVVDLREKTTRSRVIVRDILPFGRVVLEQVHDHQNYKYLDHQNTRSGCGMVRCGRLGILNLSAEARDLILNEEFEAIWQGENVVLLDGQFDVAPRLGARPKPSSDLPPLREPIAVTPIACQGSRLALQNKNVKRELQFLDTFEKDPKVEVLKNIEKRSYLLVWDSWRWKRAQVKDLKSSEESMLVTFIDEGIDKDVPKIEALLAIAPTTWLQPPAGAFHIEIPEHQRNRLNIDDFVNEELFCILQKPMGNTKYAGQLYVKSQAGELREISASIKRIEAPSAQLGLCFVMHVELASNKIYVVNSQTMDEYGTFISEKLAHLDEKRQIAKVKEGQAVLAFMSGLLCRGEVSKVNADGLVVKFIDYGNSMLVDKVFAIPDYLVTIPALAFPIPLDPRLEGHIEFGKALTIISIDGGLIKFSRMES